LRRAELTAKLIGLFANLAKGGKLTITGSSLTAVELVKMISDVCRNQEPRISSRRNIRIEFDHDSVYRAAPAQLSADLELLMQALNNVVDNAVKYSYSNSTIRIFGRLLPRGAFYIGVANKGIPIAPNETSQVKVRNWRGSIAKSSVGEGNGLGLWIVDQIMTAHGGELQVLPTRPHDGITEVRLVFSVAN
jgi:signal transduction histidine kinase